MKTLKLCLLLWVIYAKPVCAITQDSSPKCLRLLDVAGQYGFYGQREITLYGYNFRTLASNSKLLRLHGTGYTDSIGWLQGSSYNTTASLQLGFSMRAKYAYLDNPPQVLRIGLAYIGYSSFGGELVRHRSDPYDTIMHQGDIYHYDSVTDETISIQKQSRQLRLDISYIFKARVERLEYYIGAGLSAGFSFNNQVYINYEIRNYKHLREYSSSSSYGTSLGLNVHEHEELKGRTDYTGSVYIPLGIGYTFSESRPFWKRLSIFFEARPGINFIAVKGISTFSSNCIQRLLGVRFRV